MFGDENEGKDVKALSKNGLACMLKHEASQIKRYYEFIESNEGDARIEKVALVFIDEQVERIQALGVLLGKEVKEEKSKDD